MRRLALALTAAAAVLGGCITIPDQNVPKCYSDADCDQAAGEVCQEGVCYGNPPAGAFAVALTAPSDRTDLVGVERASEDLPSYGFLADLTLETPVTLSGLVSAASCAGVPTQTSCPTGALGATVTVRRAPRFAGGDGFTQTARSAAGAGDTSFTLAVPRTRAADPDFTITVVPDDTGPGSGAGPAQLVPPLRTTLRATDNVQLPLALGGANLPVVTGDLVDSDNAPVTGYRVVALGRWAGDTTDSEVSTVAYPSDGHFQLVLSAGLTGPVTIVGKPTAPASAAPTLQLIGVDGTKGGSAHLAVVPDLGAPHVATLTIEGTSTSGAVEPIAGARVIATASVASAPFPLPGSNLTAVVSAEVITGDDGVAQLPLLDGPAFAAGYHLRVVPPAGSNLTVLDDPAFALADATRVLKPRVALQGTVVDAAGQPVAGVSVTAKPSIHFQWELADASQVFLAQIPAATATTPDSGDFVLYVDPYVEDVYGHYDIALEPPSGSSVPSFLIADFAIPGGTLGPTAISLGTVMLPPAAALHGRISDPGGNAVAGSELRVFRLPADQSLCALSHAPAGCQVPAQLQAHATSDAAGIVRFTLPRP